MKIDSTFEIIRKNIEDDQTQEYKEYRRRWNENPKNYIVEDFPIHIDLESTTKCNLKCFMCFQSTNPPKPCFMEFSLFKKVIDEGIQKGLCSIKLQYRGEPMLHPKLPEMVKYAKDKGIIEVMFNTNATLLTEKKAKTFIDAGLDKIICSIDGCTKDVYESVRIGANFETVLKNVKTLQKLKKEMGSIKPLLRIQMVDTPKNHHQISSYKEFWGNIADHVAIEDMNDYSEKDTSNPVVCKEFQCPQLWQRLLVLCNGDIILCCGDLYGKLIVGNAYKDSVAEIWKSEKLNNFRKLHIKGESHKMSICAECGFRETVIKDLKCER